MSHRSTFTLIPLVALVACSPDEPHEAIRTTASAAVVSGPGTYSGGQYWRDTWGRSATGAWDTHVMSYNIRYKNSGDTGQRAWSARKRRVASTIVGQDAVGRRRDSILNVSADIVGLQEVTETQYAELRELLPQYATFYVGRNSDYRGEGPGIFWDDARFDVLDYGVFWLSHTPNTPGSKYVGQDDSPRNCVWVYLWDSLTSQALYVYSTHWSTDHSSYRNASATTMMNEITARDDIIAAYIVTGDLNDGIYVNTLRWNTSVANLKSYLDLEDSFFVDTFSSAPYPRLFATPNQWAAYQGYTTGTVEEGKNRKIDFVLTSSRVSTFFGAINNTLFYSSYTPRDCTFRASNGDCTGEEDAPTPTDVLYNSSDHWAVNAYLNLR